MSKMRKIEKVEKGTPITAEMFNNLVDYINSLPIEITGAGVQKIQQSNKSIVYINQPKQVEQVAGGAAADCSGGTPITLGGAIGTQDSDTWIKADDDCPVWLKVFTDVYWDDAGDGAIKGRVRTLKFDRCGRLFEITGEGEAILLVLFERCES